LAEVSAISLMQQEIVHEILLEVLARVAGEQNLLQLSRALFRLGAVADEIEHLLRSIVNDAGVLIGNNLLQALLRRCHRGGVKLRFVRMVEIGLAHQRARR